MFDFLREKVKPKKVAGLHCHIHSFGKSYDLAIVQLNKSKVELIESKSDLTIQKIDDILDKSLPVCLSIDGKGILTRKIDIQEFGGTPKPEKLIPHLLPNAKASEYHLQLAKGDGPNRFVSLIRKEVLAELLSEIEKSGYKIVHISIAPFPAVFVRDENQNVVQCARHQLHFEGDSLTEVSKSESNPTNEPVPVALGSASQFFIPALDRIEIKGEEITERLKMFLDERLFRFLGWGTLATILAILLINYFLFDLQNTRNEELKLSVESYQDQLNYLSALKNKTEERKAFLSDAGWTSAESRTSYYADQLAATIPDQIKLTGLQIFPRTKNKDRTKRQKWLYATSEIRITGNVSKSTIINDWMKDLNAFDWAESIELVDYSQNSSRSKGEFEIRIIIA